MPGKRKTSPKRVKRKTSPKRVKRKTSPRRKTSPKRVKRKTSPRRVKRKTSPRRKRNHRRMRAPGDEKSYTARLYIQSHKDGNDPRAEMNVEYEQEFEDKQTAYDIMKGICSRDEKVKRGYHHLLQITRNNVRYGELVYSGDCRGDMTTQYRHPDEDELRL